MFETISAIFYVSVVYSNYFLFENVSLPVRDLDEKERFPLN